MPMPAGGVPTINMDAGTDDPSQARADFLNLTQQFNQLRAMYGVANGFCALDSGGKVDNASLNASSGAAAYSKVVLRDSSGNVNGGIYYKNTPDGYCSLLNGLILQWGIYDLGSVPDATFGSVGVIFPYPFSAPAYSLMITPDISTSGAPMASTYVCAYGGSPVGSGIFTLMYGNNSGAARALRARWLAIGPR